MAPLIVQPVVSVSSVTPVGTTPSMGQEEELWGKKKKHGVRPDSLSRAFHQGRVCHDCLLGPLRSGKVFLLWADYFSFSYVF